MSNCQITDAAIRAAFQGADDFQARPIRAGGQELVLYSIDGLVSGGDISQYVLRPLMAMEPRPMAELYPAALYTKIYNAVALPCADADECADRLVHGFCVVLFPGVGALAFEVKSGVKRGPAPPETENTVKGPKDAFTETLRINTALLRLCALLFSLFLPALFIAMTGFDPPWGVLTGVRPASRT